MASAVVDFDHKPLFNQRPPSSQRRLIPHFEALDWTRPKTVRISYGPEDLARLNKRDRTRNMNKFINKTTTTWLSTNTATTVMLPSAVVQVVPGGIDPAELAQYVNARGASGYPTNRVEEISDSCSNINNYNTVSPNHYLLPAMPTTPKMSQPGRGPASRGNGAPLPGVAPGAANTNMNFYNKMDAASYAELDRRVNSTPRNTGVADLLMQREL